MRRLGTHGIPKRCLPHNPEKEKTSIYQKPKVVGLNLVLRDRYALVLKRAIWIRIISEPFPTLKAFKINSRHQQNNKCSGRGCRLLLGISFWDHLTMSTLTSGETSEGAGFMPQHLTPSQTVSQRLNDGIQDSPQYQ